jgi:hypothetical protein
MGSIEGTCAISRLTIQHGEDVRLLIIQPDASYGPFVSWHPRTYPVRAKYNDCGTYVLKDSLRPHGLEANMWLHGFKKDGIFSKKKGITRDIAFTDFVDKLCYPHLWARTLYPSSYEHSKGRVITHNRKFPLLPVVILEEVYQELLNPKKNAAALSERIAHYTALREAVFNVSIDNDAWAKISALRGEKAIFTRADINEEDPNTLFRLTRYIHAKLGPSAFDFTTHVLQTCPSSHIVYAVLQDVKDREQDMAECNDSFFATAAGFDLIDHNLRCNLNFNWFPQGPRGTQMASLEAQAEFHASMANICKFKDL